MDEIIAKNKKFKVLKVVSQVEDHSTFICEYTGIKYLVRTYTSGYEQALSDYKTLKRIGINIARLCYHDDERKVLVLDHFPEENVLGMLSKGDLPEICFDALFRLNRFAKFSKATLDWQPQNFMLRGSEMFYLPLKIGEYDPNKKLEDGGILYWFRGKEGLSLLKRKGYNVDGITPIEDGEVKKRVVLMAIKYL